MSKRRWSALLSLVVTVGCCMGCGHHIYRCPTRAMLPSMDVGDLFEVVLDPYHRSAPARGDVIVFRMPDNVPPNFKGLSVKRLIGLPGDRFALSNYQAVINGCVVDEPYIMIPEPAKRYKGGAAPGDVPEQVIPPGMCYVLGDNRGNSVDSRSFGPIPLANVTAKGTVITKSQEKTRVGRQLSQPANSPLQPPAPHVGS
jgi:signal peptidase I